MKRILYIIVTFIGISMLITIPVSFIFGETIARAFDSVLHFKIDPRLSGGNVLVRFDDPAGDDIGEGGYAYPLNAHYDGKGYLDLLRYTVHEPIADAPWSEDRDYWQVALTFASLSDADGSVNGFSHQSVNIYIDLDGKAGGSVETNEPLAEKVRFDPEHPWDVMVHIDGYHKTGKLVAADGTLIDKVRIYYFSERNTIIAQIPLRNKDITKVLDGRTTWHYVLIGGYDTLARGNFLPVKKEATLRTGGGARSEISPNVYDYLAPKGKDQKAVLSGYREKEQSFALIYPVEVNRKGAVVTQVNNDRLIASLHATLAAEAEQSAKRITGELAARKKTALPLELVVMNFRAGNFDESARRADTILTSDPGNPIALAYRGSVTAMKAGKTKSVAKAVMLVNTAFEDLDRAVTTAKSDEEKIHAYIARGSVSLEVPEVVFQKSKQGSADFTKAAEISERHPEMRVQTAELLVKSGICLEHAGKKNEAEIEFIKAKQFPLNTFSKLELIKRGIDIE
jgi:hypothetical protein